MGQLGVGKEYIGGIGEGRRVHANACLSTHRHATKRGGRRVRASGCLLRLGGALETLNLGSIFESEIPFRRKTEFAAGRSGRGEIGAVAENIGILAIELSVGKEDKVIVHCLVRQPAHGARLQICASLRSLCDEPLASSSAAGLILALPILGGEATTGVVLIDEVWFRRHQPTWPGRPLKGVYLRQHVRRY